jgi:hypothetical protein
MHAATMMIFDLLTVFLAALNLPSLASADNYSTDGSDPVVVY